MENFSKVLKITDKDGYKHSYVANYVNGELTPECKEDIERLKNGENLAAPKGEKDFVGDVPFDVEIEKELKKRKEEDEPLPPKKREDYVGDVPFDVVMKDEMTKEDIDTNDKPLDAIKDNFTPPGAEEDVKDAIDTNDNGEIEVDEMADFQKSLDDYAAKNKKGRDDIPVTTRR